MDNVLLDSKTNLKQCFKNKPILKSHEVQYEEQLETEGNICNMDVRS